MMGVLLPLKFSYLGNTLFLEEFDPTPRKYVAPDGHRVPTKPNKWFQETCRPAARWVPRVNFLF